MPSTASGVICRGTGVQVVYGPRVSVIKSDLEAFLASPESDRSEELDAREKKRETKAAPSGSCIVASPLTGEAMPLEQVEDGVFSEKMVGDGFAVQPSENRVYAPCDCTVLTVFGTKHAIGLSLENGIELLIHIGLDTVQLNGAPFDIHVKEGDELKKGDLIAVFDEQAIQEAGYRTVTPVIVTNTDQYRKFELIKSGPVKAGDEVLSVN